jgi:hypothetical protein
MSKTTYRMNWAFRWTDRVYVSRAIGGGAHGNLDYVLVFDDAAGEPTRPPVKISRREARGLLWALAKRYIKGELDEAS